MKRILFSAFLVSFAMILLMLGEGTASVIASCPGPGCPVSSTTYTIPEYWYQSTSAQAVYHKISVKVNVLTSSGQTWNGVGSYDINMDDSKVGTLTSGQSGTAQVYAGQCIQTYVGEYYSGYQVQTSTDCQNVKSKHKVEVFVQGPAVNTGDSACPATDGKTCFYDSGSKDFRYYLVSDKVQAKADGETAEFNFKIQFRWSFATLDQKNNPIDLTKSGFGFKKSDGTGPFASGNELLKEGTTLTIGWTDAPMVETSQSDTRYVYDHMTTLDIDVAKNAGPVAKVVMDGPKGTFAVWQRQFYLTVDSNCVTSNGATFSCGNPRGTGYYNEGAAATHAVDATAQDTALMGSFGSFYGFNGWTVDSAATTPSSTITMTSAKRVVAVFVYNDSVAIRNIAIAVSLGIVPVGILVLVMTRRSGRRRRPRNLPPGMYPPAPFVPPGTTYAPDGAMIGQGQVSSSALGPGGFQTGRVPPTTQRPLPPSVSGAASTEAGAGTTGGTGAGATGISTAGTNTAGTSTTGGYGTGAGSSGYGTVSRGAGGGQVTGGGSGQGSGQISGQGSGLGVTGTVAATAAGVAAATGIGAVALARRATDKCVWCGSKVKRDELVCSRCGVHQECSRCGTPLYKTTLVSKGYSANPQDEGLFCDRCNEFTA